MIQRVQSVYLLLAAICFGIAAFLDWVVYIGSAITLSFMETSGGSLVLGLTAFACCDAMMCIFMYNNRQLQVVASKSAMLAGVAAMIAFSAFHFLTLSEGNDAETQTLAYDLAFPLVAVGVILLWLAMKAIKKDEDLVKSVDRLR